MLIVDQTVLQAIIEAHKLIACQYFVYCAFVFDFDVVSLVLSRILIENYRLSYRSKPFYRKRTPVAPFIDRPAAQSGPSALP
jgi:hypothetical protein